METSQEEQWDAALADALIESHQAILTRYAGRGVLIDQDQSDVLLRALACVGGRGGCAMVRQMTIAFSGTTEFVDCYSDNIEDIVRQLHDAAKGVLPPVDQHD